MNDTIKKHRDAAFITCPENCWCWLLENAETEIARLRAELKEARFIIDMLKATKQPLDSE